MLDHHNISTALNDVTSQRLDNYNNYKLLVSLFCFIFCYINNSLAPVFSILLTP